ncbi:hypothetical protein MLD38_026885 [Melastoma candidum]|uniref:Uncharacterized protein n=1 Tax=Melastoma candidum TaxID=119954 RepID=A0ACB9NZU1_9MYRT|nr:hypothetical protein MLD38_026885 [Melastoma candidum]
MKGRLDRTKVVLRHLPPLITRGALIDQIDAGFAGRYDWVAFRPGKSSQKQQIYSRAYINFKRPEDVIEFAEFFDGHVFVNEKGTQFKTIVEYAPSQRVPKLTSKRDGREGTLLKDPEYLEFLEILSKPVENLPSAEIQMERREAERSGAAKETPIITPLMDFVRQKRASKAASRRVVSNKKQSGRAVSSGGPGSSKQGSEKRKNSKAMYVLRDSARSSGGKDASTITLASRRDYQHISDKPMSSIVAAGADRTEVESGSSGAAGSGKKKILLLKGKEREIYHMASNASGEQLSAKDLGGPTAIKQDQCQEGSGRIIRGILVNKNAKQNQPGVHSDNQTQTTHAGREKMPPRAPNLQPISKEANGAIAEKVHGNGASSFGSEKLERRILQKASARCLGGRDYLKLEKIMMVLRLELNQSPQREEVLLALVLMRSKFGSKSQVLERSVQRASMHSNVMLVTEYCPSGWSFCPF